MMDNNKLITNVDKIQDEIDVWHKQTVEWLNEFLKQTSEIRTETKAQREPPQATSQFQKDPKELETNFGQ